MLDDRSDRLLSAYFEQKASNSFLAARDSVSIVGLEELPTVISKRLTSWFGLQASAAFVITPPRGPNLHLLPFSLLRASSGRQ